MLQLQRLWKPWFVYRPTQIPRRIQASMSEPRAGYRPLPTSWGVDVTADPTKTIGRNIVNTGLYDIAVSEALARLIRPGDTVVDAGANIGYMTLLAALAAGPRGKVHAFEPHPDLSQLLRANVAAASASHALAPVEVHQSALGEERGTAELSMPDGFDSNDGIAMIVEGDSAGVPTVQVPLETLDDVLGDTPVEVMKLDVEGFEYHVLRGARRAFEAGRIRHVVFEDFHSGDSEVIRMFQSLGYEVYALGWKVRGLAIEPIASGKLAMAYEAPNFIATTDPVAMRARCIGGAWQVLQPGLGR